MGSVPKRINFLKLCLFNINSKRALTLSSVLSVIHMNDAVAGRYTWIIYILLILVVLLTSYVITRSNQGLMKCVRNC